MGLMKSRKMKHNTYLCFIFCDFAKILFTCTIVVSFLHKQYLNTVFNIESGLV